MARVDRNAELLEYLQREGPKSFAELEERFGCVYKRVTSLEKKGVLRRRLEENPNHDARWARSFRIVFEPTGKPLPVKKSDHEAEYYRLWYSMKKAKKESTKRRTLEELKDLALAFGFIQEEKRA